MFEGMHNKMAIFSPDSHLLLSFLIKMLGLGAIALLIGFPEGHFDDLDGTTYFWTFVCNNTPVAHSQQTCVVMIIRHFIHLRCRLQHIVISQA